MENQTLSDGYHPYSTYCHCRKPELLHDLQENADIRNGDAIPDISHSDVIVVVSSAPASWSGQQDPDSVQPSEATRLPWAVCLVRRHSYPNHI